MRLYFWCYELELVILKLWTHNYFYIYIKRLGKKDVEKKTRKIDTKKRCKIKDTKKTRKEKAQKKERK